ncbi:MAG: phenylalanine--tRNA ligase subunit alpha, partial [Lachnospiraceae bacterium]|nr:phenylalanine--tRNA ligase subunit alpha [Lachnospiraceae bacterium]
MKEKLAQIQAEAIESMLSAADPDVLNDIRVRFLGKKGLLTEASKGMKDVPAEERP